MKVVSISLPKAVYKPGDAVIATVTVQREVESGGIVQFYLRRAGQVWQSGPVVTVGTMGLSLPDIFAAGQLQQVSATFNLPSDASGNYQIGAKERSESGLTINGVASFSVNPSTPVPTIAQTTVTFIPNRSDVKDAVVYVDGSPLGILTAWGYTAVLSPGKHTVSAEGSLFSAASTSVTLSGGTTVKIPVMLVPKSSKSSSESDGFKVGANVQTAGLVVVCAAIGIGLVWVATREG
jgi:hypothetical protein